MLHLLSTIAAVSNIDLSGLPKIQNPGPSQIQQVLTIVFSIIGAVSVLMIVIGGMRYVTAQADPQQLSKAKSTIIYAIVGLLVSIMAVAIVTFVIGRAL